MIVRRSTHGWWPHFLYSADLITFEEYTPAKPNHHLILPPPFYRGIVKVTTAEQQPSTKSSPAAPSYTLPDHSISEHTPLPQSSASQRLSL
jgi:hypothetical protein